MHISRNAMAVALALAASALHAATPIAWWDMENVNQNGTVADKSGNGHDLTLYGAVSVVDGSVSGKGLYFNPDTATSRAKFSCPALTSRSVSMWVRWDSGDGEDDGIPHLFSVLSGMRVLGVSSANSPVNKGTLYIGDSPAVTLNWCVARGEWMHIALSVDIDEGTSTASVRFYQNGALRVASDGVAIGARSRWYVQSNATLGNNGDALRSFHGFMDEVKVFDTAITAKEVYDEYSRVPFPYDVVAHWKCDSIAPNGTVPDETGRFALERVSGVSLVDDPFRGHALMFDGLNGTCARVYTTNLYTRFTFAAWLNVPTDSATADLTSGNLYPRLFAMQSDYPRVQLTSSTSEYLANIYYASDGDRLRVANGLADKGRWTHFAVTHDVECGNDGMYRLTSVCYVNGEPMARNDSQSLSITGQSDGRDVFGLQPDAYLYIGGNGGNRPFYGMLSDVWLFSRALSANEVRQLAKGVAKVDAGADFSVSTGVAVLSGTRNPDGARYPLRTTAGTCLWSLVSAPNGVVAEDVPIANPYSLLTEVSLPSDGAYTFRLENTGCFSIAEADEVTVTRTTGMPASPYVSVVAYDSAVEMPAPAHLVVSATDGARVFWRKKSGSGGVYFSSQSLTNDAMFTAAGTYVLECTAEKGGATASTDITVTVAAGTGTCAKDETMLVQRWSFDQGPWADIGLVRGTWLNGYAMKLSRAGYGIGDTMDSANKASYYDSGVVLPLESRTTLAFWMYHDSPVSGADTKNCRVFYEDGLQIQYNNQSATPRFVLYGGGYTFTSPYLTDAVLRNGALKGRWSHIAITADLSDYVGVNMPPASRVKFYVDGVGFDAASVADNGAQRDGSGNYVIQRTASTHKARLGGGGDVNKWFPGILDEIRYYTNTLSAAQIARLAFEFSSENLAPIVELPVKPIRTLPDRNVSLTAVVSDDGIGTLSYAWEQVSGDTDRVTLQNGNSAVATACFDVPGTYQFVLVAADGTHSVKSAPLTVEVVPRGFSMTVK